MLFHVYLTDGSDADEIFMTLLINDLPAVEPITLFNATQAMPANANNDSYSFPSGQWVNV